MIKTYTGNPKKDVRRAVRNISAAYGFDYGLVFDLYLILSGESERPESEIQTDFERFVGRHPSRGLSANLWTVFLSDRRTQISAITTLPFWGELLHGEGTPIEKTETLCSTLAELYAQGRMGICFSCHLRKKCSYATSLEKLDPSSNLFPDPESAHPECPLRPREAASDLPAVLAVIIEVLSDEILSEALVRREDGEELRDLLVMMLGSGKPGDGEDGEAGVSEGDSEETGQDSDSKPPAKRRGSSRGCGKDKKYVPSRRGSHLTPRIRRLLELLRQSRQTGSIRLLMLSENFRRTLELGAQQKMSFKISNEDPIDASYRVMDSMDDVVHADSTTLSLEDHEFDRRMAEGELVVRKNLTVEKKSALYFTELDVSGSMGGDTLTPTGPMSSGEVAVALLLAITSRARKQKSGMGIQLFSGSPGERRFELDDTKLVDLAQWIALCDFDGGGTDVVAAIRAGFKQIVDAKTGLGPDAEHVKLAEVLLITDGEDPSLYDSRIITNLLEYRTNNSINLNILHICSQEGGDAEKSFRRLATQYLRVDPTDPDFLNMAGLMTTE